MAKRIFIEVSNKIFGNHGVFRRVQDVSKLNNRKKKNQGKVSFNSSISFDRLQIVLSLFTIYQWNNGLCTATSGEYGMCLPESECKLIILQAIIYSTKQFVM